MVSELTYKSQFLQEVDHCVSMKDQLLYWPGLYEHVVQVYHSANV